ncbi:HAD family hydrolase [uncultured Jatrophihabitans sp.]|uniref:HAD family hydrolase n=1 Tax=uncultured Jatrophihabitans sp. TaxID=1610747 RepID=UPI0035CA94F3
MTDAVIFDFDGTLTPGRTDKAQAAARKTQADALGVDVDRLDAEMTATVDVRFTGAGGSIEGSLAWVCERLDVRPTPAQLAEAARVRLAAEQAFGRPRPEAVRVLTTLRAAGLRIGVVSDCSAELPRYFPDLSIAPLVDAPVRARSVCAQCTWRSPASRAAPSMAAIPRGMVRS